MVKLFKRQFEVSEALAFRGKNREDFPTNTEIGLAHVRAFFGSFEAESDAADIFCSHEASGSPDSFYPVRDWRDDDAAKFGR
jgi:hypothetical protein